MLLPTQSYNFKQTKYKSPSNDYYIRALKPKTLDFTTFRGNFSTIALVARSGISAINSNKMANLLRDFDEIVTHPSAYKEILPDTLLAIAKTPYSASDKPFFTFFSLIKNSLGTVDTTKLQAIANHVPSLINDNSNRNIQIKKDFMLNVFNEGLPVDGYSIDEFSKLDDKYYKNIKQEIIDMTLHSDAYWTNVMKRDKRMGDNPKYYQEQDFKALSSLELIKRLDPQTHAEYINKKAPIIIELKKIVINKIMNNPSENELYYSYCNDFHLGGDTTYGKEWRFAYGELTKALWEGAVSRYKNDKKQISQALHLDERYVEMMLEGPRKR